MSGAIDADAGTGATMDTTTREVTVELLFPIAVGKGERARQIHQLLFRRPTLGQLREIERVGGGGNHMATVAEMVKQLGCDAENPGAVLLPGLIDQLDLADIEQVSKALKPFFPNLARSTGD